MEEFNDRLKQHRTMAYARERVISNQAKVYGKTNEKQNLSNHYHALREDKKRSVSIKSKLADSLKVKDDIVAAKEFDISQAVKEAKAVEQYHYTDVMKETKEKTAGVQSQLDAQKLVNTALINRAVTADQNAEKGNRQSTSSVRQSEESVEMSAAYNSNIKLLQSEVKQLRGDSTKF